MPRRPNRIPNAIALISGLDSVHVIADENSGRVAVELSIRMDGDNVLPGGNVEGTAIDLLYGATHLLKKTKHYDALKALLKDEAALENLTRQHMAGRMG